MSLDEIALLREALELPESERRAFVERRCADDPARRARLLDLVVLDAEGDTLLDGGVDALLADAFAGDAAPAPPMVDRSGETIGPWRILRHLAEGGMGSVWLAERADGAFAQTVALKTIKPGMDSAAVLRAFERERSLLARLQHPQIAHLIDGGVDASVRPWFAMRYVEGEPLDLWLQQAPPLHRRLELFASLCRVLAYAHRQLVVHQDIKPGNVIVQADGTPCLLDFGIGRILQGDAAGGIQTVQRFASPAYAAPEQIAGGAISTATDVYALGTILFELLTGRRYNRHAIERIRAIMAIVLLAAGAICAAVLIFNSFVTGLQGRERRAPADSTLAALAVLATLAALAANALSAEPDARVEQGALLLGGALLVISLIAAALQWVRQHPLRASGAALGVLTGLLVLLAAIGVPFLQAYLSLGPVEPPTPTSAVTALATGLTPNTPVTAAPTAEPMSAEAQRAEILFFAVLDVVMDEVGLD